MIPLAAKVSGVQRALQRLRSLYAPANIHPWMWVEVLAMTLCAWWLGYFFQRENPFQIGGEFPWIWLAPMLAALRYGVLPGVAASVVLIGLWLFQFRSGPDNEFPEQFFLGGLILVMLCGEFGTTWRTRLRRAEESNHYLEERMNRITLRHLMLRLSHDRMEQEVLTKPVTLRDALIGLRALTMQHSASAMPAARALLQMLTQYCQLESAAIYVPSRGGNEYVRVSDIGSPPELRIDDPLLHHALEQRSLAHLRTEGLTDATLPTPFLVVAPIMTSDGYQLGVLAIRHMPFLALNDENLQMLSVMLGYYADCVVEAAGAGRIHERLPHTPEDFAGELHRLLQLQRNFGIDSHIVILTFSNDESGRSALVQLARIRRGLDIVWQLQSADRLVLANLMPLANRPAVEGYLLRIDSMLKEHLGLAHADWSLHSTEISLSQTDPIAALLTHTQGMDA